MDKDALVIKIVNRYIGVEGGYLGDFSYRTHKDFYPEYCDLCKNPDLIDGTTRERFIHIFKNSTSKEQAKIVYGVIERFPVGLGPTTRSEELKNKLIKEAEKLEQGDYVENPRLNYTATHIIEILEDATSLIENRKASSAIDRVHTAFHGYLRDICSKEKIDFTEKEDLVKLIKKLFAQHQKLKINHKTHEIQNIVKNLVSIANSLSPVRNQGSRAHPNKKVLDENESILVINAVRTTLIYIDSKIKEAQT